MAWRTTDDPRNKYATLRLTADEEADLLAFASRRGISKSAAVRVCVDRVIAAEARQAARQKHASEQS